MNKYLRTTSYAIQPTVAIQYTRQSLDETLNSTKLKPAALHIVDLCLAEGIS